MSPLGGPMAGGSAGSQSPKPRIGEILVKAGLIDELQLSRALGEQQQWGGRLGLSLLKLGFVTEEELLQTLGRQLRVPIVRLGNKWVDPEILAAVPLDVCEKYHCLPLFAKREGGREVLYVGMEDPTDLGAVDDLSFQTGRRVQPVLMGPLELREALARFYRTSASGPEAVGLDRFPEAPLEPGDTAPLLRGLGEEDVESSFTRAPKSPPPAAPSRSSAPKPSADEDLDEMPVPKAEKVASRTAAPRAPAAEASPPAADDGVDKPREAATREILRAVTELLIEKGVIDRTELVERVAARRRRDARGGRQA